MLSSRKNGTCTQSPATLTHSFFFEGVYTADPAIDPSAEFIPEITHMEALERRLRVMDSTALALCMENAMPLDVFNMDDEQALARIISGERVGTLVSTPQGDADGG